MKKLSSGTIISACGAVALLSLWSTLDFHRATEDVVGGNRDVYKIGEQEVRFEAVAAALPATGTIGYVSDQSPDQPLGLVMYFGAQYALAPRLLVEQQKRPESQWVVSNFSKPLDVGHFSSERGLKIIKDFGSGVVLFQSGVR